MNHDDLYPRWREYVAECGSEEYAQPYEVWARRQSQLDAELAKEQP